MRKHPLPFILLAACLLVFSVTSARPADAMSFLKKLFGKESEQVAPAQSALPEYKYLQDFMMQSQPFVKTVFKATPITYEVRLPAEWEPQAGTSPESAVNDRFLNALDQYVGPIIVGGDRPTFQVQAMRLRHEILLEHWLQNYIYQNGYTQQGDLDIISETSGSAKFIHLQNGISFMSHIKAYILGNIVLAARIDVPLIADERIREYATHIINSFNVKEFQSGPIEETSDFSFQGKIRFTYPTSWQIKNPAMSNPNIKSLELQNLLPSGGVKGLIRFIAYRKTPGTSVEELTESFKNGLIQTHGLRIIALSGGAPLMIGLNFDTAYTERYQAGLKDTIHNDYEVWVTALDSDDWINFIYLITPNNNRDYYDWARNTRAYDLIIHSIN